MYIYAYTVGYDKLTSLDYLVLVLIYFMPNKVKENGSFRHFLLVKGLRRERYDNMF